THRAAQKNKGAHVSLLLSTKPAKILSNQRFPKKALKGQERLGYGHLWSDQAKILQGQRQDAL
ncbi:MAG: hypothetical protein IJS50_01490, partial [Desulfovibrio sp.]|nr:hypothetical protein [Desulfovibrio sp.]